MTEADFYALCKAHDLTYQYTEDHRYWRRGVESLARVTAAAKQLPREVAVRIWNSVVDEKILAEFRKEYYWTE